MNDNEIEILQQPNQSQIDEKAKQCMRRALYDYHNGHRAYYFNKFREVSQILDKKDILSDREQKLLAIVNCFMADIYWEFGTIEKQCYSRQNS